MHCYTSPADSASGAEAAHSAFAHQSSFSIHHCMHGAPSWPTSTKCVDQIVPTQTNAHSQTSQPQRKQLIFVLPYICRHLQRMFLWGGKPFHSDQTMHTAHCAQHTEVKVPSKPVEEPGNINFVGISNPADRGRGAFRPGQEGIDVNGGHILPGSDDAHIQQVRPSLDSHRRSHTMLAHKHRCLWKLCAEK